MMHVWRFPGWRLLPILAWLALQIGALAVPVHASVPAEARALFAALDVDRIVICTPEGRKVLTRDGETGEEGLCLPCKAASWTGSLHGPGCAFGTISYSVVERIAAPSAPAVDLHARSGFQSRAPPVLPSN